MFHSTFFDIVFDDAVRLTNKTFYPQFWKSVGENKYELQLPLAGYSKNDVTFEVFSNSDDVKLISITLKDEEHKIKVGLPTVVPRKYVEEALAGSTLENGMLTLRFKKPVITEEEKKSNVLNILK